MEKSEYAMLPHSTTVSLLLYTITPLLRRYNRLYTITAQCDEAAAGTTGKLLEQVVKSFAAPPLQDAGRRT
jgi:hypothetical protein